MNHLAPTGRRFAAATLALAITASACSSADDDARDSIVATDSIGGTTTSVESSEAPTSTEVSTTSGPEAAAPSTSAPQVSDDSFPLDSYELTTSGVPRVEERTCDGPIPADDRTKCLTLVVPESRAAGTAAGERLVRIPVAVIGAWGSERQPDPVVWLDNSAGDGFIAQRVSLFTENDPNPVNELRDIITLDLRGTGLAEPSLACAEVTELNAGPFTANVDPTSDEGRAMRLEAVEACHDRLVADGVDLSAYASEDAAQDLEDLRQALGIAEWNFISGEYASKLAQLLARDHPETLRGVVALAQPVPLQADWFADQAGNALRGWSALVDACAADTSCNEAYPDLGSRLESYVADLESKPRRFESVALDFPGLEAPFLLTASRLLVYVRWYTRAANFFFQVPLSIAGPTGATAGVLETFDPDDPATLTFQATDAYAAPGWGIWEMFPQNASNDQGSFALGAFLSAMCSDEAPFTDPAALAVSIDVPLFGSLLGRDGNLEACKVWDVEPASRTVNEPAVSDVPFLVFAGAYDTVSSPHWAEAFAEGLSRATVVHLDLGSHPTASSAPSTARECAVELRGEFLADPTAAIDTSCVDTAIGPAFALP